jgi:hypothetical protein
MADTPTTQQNNTSHGWSTSPSCCPRAAPLLPDTSLTSHSLLATRRPMLVLAIAAQHLGSHPALISALPTVQTKQNKVSILCFNWSNTILAVPRQQLLEMANSNGDSDGQRRWQLQWPMVMETAMANGKGDSNGNGDG